MVDRATASASALLGVLLLVTYAYFVSPPSWNENSRFDLTRSLVERRRLDIEPYHHNTGDKSFYRGRHYSDKAPGASLLAVPAYAVYRAGQWLTGGSPPASLPRAGLGELPGRDEIDDEMAEADYLVNPSFRRALYLCNLATNVVAGAALGVLCFLTLRRRFKVPPRPAFAAVAALGLGSLAFPYATMFYGHVLAATCLFAGFVLLTLGTAAPARWAAAGFLAGLAVLTELPTAPAAAALALFAVLRSPRRTVWFVVGVIGPALGLLAYQYAAFGDALRPGYAYVSRTEFAEGMSRGLMGVTLPKLDVLAAMLVGRARGLLYLSPVLALAFWGLGRWTWRAWREGRSDRLEASLSAAIVAYFLLMNAGYYMWHGGSALGPRHLIPALPFLCLGLPFAFRRWRPLVVGVPLAVSIVHQLVATAVGPTAPLVDDVLRDHVYRRFLAGRVADGLGPSNLGALLGLPGASSLIPLGVVWALALPVLIPLLPRAAPETIIQPPDAA